MLAYVKAENDYADRMLAHIKPLETRVYNEIIGRLQQDDSTRAVSHERLLVLPALRDRQGISDLRAPQGHRRTRPRKSCSTSTKWPRATTSSRSATSPSAPTASCMAWAEDTVGRRQYVVKVMDLATHQVLPIALPNVENNIVWAGDNKTFLYVEKDPETLLGFACASHSHRQRQSHRRGRRSAGLGAEGRQLLHAAVPHQGREVPAHPHAEHGVVGGLVRGRHRSRSSSSSCSCRASATTNTRWNTPTAAGSCAPTTRRRTSASWT